ncbi:MAG TPA: lactonase family protein [Polyangiaceae bacterium]
MKRFATLVASVVALVAPLGGCGSSSGGDFDAGLYVPPPNDASMESGDASVESGGGGPDSGGAVDAPVEARAGDGEAGAAMHLVAYASGYGPNIQWLSVNGATGATAPVGSVASFGSAPSFLAVDAAAKHLYAVDENATGQVGAYAIDPATGALTFQNAVSSGGNGPPFVTVDGSGKWVLVANYGDGTVSVLPIQGDGSLGAPAQTLNAGANAHMIAPDPSNRFVFVPCKGVDYIAQYVFDATAGKLTPNATPTVATASGAGPRHIAFHPTLNVAYVIAENASTVTSYAFDTTAGTLAPTQTISTLPSGFSGTNTGAEIHVHPSGKWLFASNRGDDSIAIFALDAAGAMTAHGFTKSGGTTPRDFSLDPPGALLYAANQGSGNVVPFRFDASSGSLTTAGGAVTVPMASFVGFAALP